MLGQGEFGKVLAADWITSYTTPPVQVAVKMLKEGHNDEDLMGLYSEMQVMKQIGKHTNIINLLGDLQAELWKSPYLGVLPGESDSIEIVDADDDAAIEIVVGIRFGLVAFEPTFQFVFSDGFESGDMSAWSSTLP